MKPLSLRRSDGLVVGLDVGTTRVRTLIARPFTDGWVALGHSTVEMRGGMKKATVIDLDIVKEAITESVRSAARQAGVTVDSVWVGVTGSHIKSEIVSVSLDLSPNGSVIMTDHLQELSDLAKAKATFSDDRSILHVLPLGFSLDSVTGVRRPVGLTARRLGSNVHVVTVFSPFLRNLERAVHEAHLNVAGMVLQPLCAGLAVLSESERSLGCVLIDVGGGTTDVAVFHDGGLVYSFALPVGGAFVTKDLAIGLRTSLQDAERLKVRWGCAKTVLAGSDPVEVSDLGSGRSRTVPRGAIASIIQARMSEIFEMVRQRLKKEQQIPSVLISAVLTGGGALLEGTVALSEEILEMPCRLGTPFLPPGAPKELRSPFYATVVGLVLHGIQFAGEFDRQPAKPGVFSRIWRKIRSLLGT